MRCVWEHNVDDTLLYSLDCIGAFTRGQTLAIAMEKMEQELASYRKWSGRAASSGEAVIVVQQKESKLNIRDADSDVIFDAECDDLSMKEYRELKELALKSAADFDRLYRSVPDPDVSCLSKRLTFYGQVPTTAREMYEHTKSVNEYYFAEIGIDADNEGTISECRQRGFDVLEQRQNFLHLPVIEGSYSELWSLRKVLRRFIWHDRIHAKAMYRMAVRTFGEGAVPDVFFFEA